MSDAIYQIPGFTLPKGRSALTRAELADAFGVAVTALESQAADHGDELREHGMTVLTGDSLSVFKTESGISSRAGSLTVYPSTAVTVSGFLLTESDIARQFRTQVIRKLQQPSSPRRKRVAGPGSLFPDELEYARQQGVKRMKLPSGFEVEFDTSGTQYALALITRAVDDRVSDKEETMAKAVMYVDQTAAVAAQVLASIEHQAKQAGVQLKPPPPPAVPLPPAPPVRGSQRGGPSSYTGSKEQDGNDPYANNA